MTWANAYAKPSAVSAYTVLQPVASGLISALLFVIGGTVWANKYGFKLPGPLLQERERHKKRGRETEREREREKVSEVTITRVSCIPNLAHRKRRSLLASFPNSKHYPTKCSGNYC